MRANLKIHFGDEILFLKIVVEVEVWRLDTNVVLTWDTENTLDRRGSQRSTGRSHRPRGCHCYWCNGGRLAGRQGSRNGLLDKRSELGDDLSDKVGIIWWGNSDRLWLSNDWPYRCCRLADCDEALLNVPCFFIATRSSSVTHSDQAAQWVDVAVRQSYKC